MKILAACEESQAVTIAFRNKGHEAYSCDLQDCSGGHPEWHIQNDIFNVLIGGFFRLQNGKIIEIGSWDKVISFQPCTDIAVSGAKHFWYKREDGRQEKSIRFFFEVWKWSNCSENPVGILNGGEYVKKWFPELYKEMKDYGFPFKSSQIIQPWMFGDDASKKTCLWLKGLPILLPTHSSWKKRYSNQTPSGQNKLGPSPERAKNRSKTFPGIAAAMASQWG